jgi:hypothetical protein
MTEPFLTQKDFDEAEEQLQKEGVIEWGKSHPIHRIFNAKSDIVEAVRVYCIIREKKRKLQKELQRINELMTDD